MYVAEPDLTVLDITAADQATALAVMAALDRLWATSGTGTLRRVPGEAGVGARLYADLRRPAPFRSPGLRRGGRQDHPMAPGPA
ncbi:DUF6207 family protein [Streptomyces sp. NPDC019443]|uniref:DUF6207 family protein n=1 Tax=Streptomyces sp. NPDC019443 TaxID=3365061 RepID=UPI00379C2068